MGLLTTGEPLGWPDVKPLVEHIKGHGVTQFVHLYHRLKGRQGDCLRWGDEIEYIIVHLDEQSKKATVSLRGAELLHRLQATEQLNAIAGGENKVLWRPEYASYMLEATPGTPYGALLACFNVVEANMRVRRSEARQLLLPGEHILSVGSFMRLGCGQFTRPPVETKPDEEGGCAQSLFFPDEAIYSAHPRFKNLTRNIRLRRGEKVAINVPIFKDERTPSPFVEDFGSLGLPSPPPAAKPDHIYMDAMGFGMGCCCLQVTFQAVNISEARWLYDQLTPITPVLLALSAATPVFRGYLADVDSRWDVISASVDDRTAEERGVSPLQHDKFRLDKSRYDTTDAYIYACSAPYNDIELCYERRHYDALVAGGIDPLLAQHVAHLFVRDPLQVFRERIEQDDEKSTEHFETIQSSNWHNMRFKPPPPDTPDIGWRVEFRPTEVQLTDFENAAYVCFVVLLSRVLLSFRLTFLMPLSKVNENMARAQRRDAVLGEKLHFRRTLANCATPPDLEGREVVPERVQCPGTPSEDMTEMTLDEIINGLPKGSAGAGSDVFPGLVPLCRQFLDSADVDVDTRCTVTQYLNFIQQRASGKICTAAHWIRRFVTSHADYKQDSVVSESITYDLLKLMADITEGKEHCPLLLGTFRSKTDDKMPDAVRRAEEVLMTARNRN